MSDREPFYALGKKPPALRVAKAGELLFTFAVGPDTIRCELRDHGEYGIEAQFLDPVDVVIARTFRQDLDVARTPRAMVNAWAGQERKAFEG